MSESTIQLVMIFGLLGVAAVLTWLARVARHSDEQVPPQWRDDFT